MWTFSPAASRSPNNACSRSRTSASGSGAAIPESAGRVAEVRRFENDYFGNGQLHIVNADTGALIGRKDPYIPLNMFLDQEAADAEIARWKALAEQRRERGKRYAEEMERNARGYDVTVTSGC